MLDKFRFSEVNMILETERLYLREMNQSDFDSLCSILQDEDTMYAMTGPVGEKGAVSHEADGPGSTS